MTTETIERTEKKVKQRVGRPNIPVEDKIESNGFSRKQWRWIQKEAKAKGIDAAQYQRMFTDWWIDSIESSRSASVATRKDDLKFERLIKSKKQKKLKA